MSDKMKSRKLWLSVAAAILPVLAKVLWPDMDTEVIIVAVIGAVAGIMGISMEDVAKQKRAAVEAAAAAGKPSGSES
tara:strand:- start:6268 stop:6498 length:231 start_codon:yes stop_codon:yes gene_type:complete